MIIPNKEKFPLSLGVAPTPASLYEKKIKKSRTGSKGNKKPTPKQSPAISQNLAQASMDFSGDEITIQELSKVVVHSAVISKFIGLLILSISFESLCNLEERDPKMQKKYFKKSPAPKEIEEEGYCVPKGGYHCV